MWDTRLEVSIFKAADRWPILSFGSKHTTIVVCLNIQDCEIFTGGRVNCVWSRAAE